MENRNVAVYEIRNLANGKRYIGGSAGIANRWRGHAQSLVRGDHHSRLLQSEWNEFRPGAFQFNRLLVCDRANLHLYEQTCMDYYRPEYNTSPTAGSQLGYRMTDADRARMSASRRKDFSSMKGKKHTEEAKAKISASRKGKGGGTYSPERIANTRAGMLAARSVLSDEKVILGRQMKRQGATAQQVADAVGCSIWVAYDFLQRRTFANIQEE